MAEIKIGEQNPKGENTPALDSLNLQQNLLQTDSSTVDSPVLESASLIQEGAQLSQETESEVLIETIKTQELNQVENTVLDESDSLVQEGIQTSQITESEVLIEAVKPQDVTKDENTIAIASVQENNSYGNKLVTIKKEEPKVEEKKEIQIIDESKKEDEKPLGDLFVNYDSEFHKNEKTIIQRIRQFKMTPKTSFSFVLILIVITVSGIGVMMRIDPVNHNIDNYKANILALIGKKPEVKINTGITMGVNTGTTIDTGTGVSNTGTEVDIGTGVTNTGTTIDTGTGDTNTGALDDKEEMMLKEKRLTVKPDVITNPDGTISYLYNGKVYTKEELQEQLKTEVQSEINKKTKDYLNKIYIDN